MSPEPVTEEMVPLDTVPEETRLKSEASTPTTGWLKVTEKEAELLTELPGALIDNTFGNAGEKGTAGTNLSSNLKRSNLIEPEALRAFLFYALPMRLRKVFKRMVRVPKQKPKKQANGRALCIGGAAKV